MRDNISFHLTLKYNHQTYVYRRHDVSLVSLLLLHDIGGERYGRNTKIKNCFYLMVGY